MVPASTSAQVAERALKMAAASVYVPRAGGGGGPSCLLPLSEAFQDQQEGLTQASFKLLLLPCFPEHVRFCVPFKSGTLFPTALSFSHIQALLAFKARHSGSSSCQCRTPGLRSPMWGSDPSLLGEIVVIVQFVGGPPGGMGLDYTTSLSPTHLVVPSLYL